MTDNVLKLHPIWKEVAKNISARVAAEGYGFLLTWKHLREVLEIGEYEIGMNVREIERISIDKLSKIEGLRDELLFEHCIWMENERSKGYRILSPDDQVTRGYNRIWRRVRKSLKKAIDVLVHVNSDLLSDKGTLDRDRNLNRTVFVMKAANKRKIPEMKRKQLG